MTSSEKHRTGRRHDDAARQRAKRAREHSDKPERTDPPKGRHRDEHDEA